MVQVFFSAESSSKSCFDKSVKYSPETLVTRGIWYAEIVQVWVATTGHCFVKVAAVLNERQWNS